MPWPPRGYRSFRPRCVWRALDAGARHSYSRRVPIRVATLNLWNRMEPWEKRLTTIRNELTTLDADIVALQEVVQVKPASSMGSVPSPAEFGFDQARAIADGLDYATCFGRNVESPYPMGNAILSRWPILR